MGLPASAPGLSAQVFLAGQTLQGAWEPVCTVSAAREASQGLLAVTPHAQDTLGHWWPCPQWLFGSTVLVSAAWPGAILLKTGPT